MDSSNFYLVLFVTALFTLVMAMSSFAQTNGLGDVITDCCGRGLSFAEMGRNCSDMSSLPDVRYAQREACKAVFMSCCHRQKYSDDCSYGITHRLDEERGDCATVPEDSCDRYSAGKECCNCCGLGIEAYSLGIPCDHMSLNTPCDHAFETCCTLTRQEHDVTTEPPFDPCINSPCSQGCQIVDSNYKCLCIAGYELAADRTTCLDINECAGYPYPCEDGEECFNQPGTFVCRESGRRISCPRGLRYNRGSRLCEDIDECTERTDNCRPPQTCYNIFKSFRCVQRHQNVVLCPDGYEQDQRTNRCVDINECARENYPCVTGQRCENSEGSFRCVRAFDCGTGYTLNAITQQCEDINECAQSVSSCGTGFRCENLDGSFVCNRAMTCGSGYTLHALTQTCEDVNECTAGLARCRRNQQCVNLAGSHTCENCEDGYRIDSRNQCSIDVDECAERMDSCSVRQRCVNTRGSYRCDCLNGFDFDSIRNDCFDVDECNPPDGRSPCLPHQSCYNLPGEYDCQNMCSYGSRYTRGTCVDINECAEGTHQCQAMQECINQEGGHLCRCPVGYRLTRSRRGCEDIDECTSIPNSCRGECLNTDGSFSCICPEGYTLNDNGFSCNDVNECTMQLDDCNSDQECFNTLGGYKCRSMECPEYYDRRLAGNQRECVKNYDNCPPRNDACLSNVTTQYTFSAMALPSIPYISSPIRLMTMDISKSTMSQVVLRLVDGNERNYFQVQKRLLSSVHVRASLMLIQAVNGPYETDLRLEINTMINNELTQQTVVVIHVDIGENLW